MYNNKQSAFTLIELLMVIAIIGILAGILIPAVGAVRKQANVAASKSQLSNYVNAIGLFKSEYNFYPDFGASVTGDSYAVDLASKSPGFIETLSGRDANGVSLTPAKAKSTGNRRRIAFHSFSESEFFFDASDKIDADQLADRFNNTNIVIEIDADGDGFVKPTGSSDKIRTPVTAYVGADSVDDTNPTYTLWD
jgi:prepilin-type N-terminal cleavage/methylation domain-containing protein